LARIWLKRCAIPEVDEMPQLLLAFPGTPRKFIERCEANKIVVKHIAPRKQDDRPQAI
jgi:hypothetical protein